MVDLHNHKINCDFRLTKFILLVKDTQLNKFQRFTHAYKSRLFFLFQNFLMDKHKIFLFEHKYAKGNLLRSRLSMLKKN